MSDWLKRAPTWQFVLLWDGVMVLAVLIGMSAGQWLWHHHLDPIGLLGAAVGSALGTTIIAVGYRQSEKYSTGARRLAQQGDCQPAPAGVQRSEDANPSDRRP